MREIKFRAWIPSSQTMIEHREVIERAHLLFEGSLNSSDIVMQDTGLEDKNGLTEVYEGDIVKISGGYHNYNRSGQVIFDDECGWWTIADEVKNNVVKSSIYGDSIQQTLRNKNILEVIGNIYENPELLDKD